MVDVYKWSIFDIGQFRQTGFFVFNFFPLILCTDIYLWGATYGSSPPYMTLRRSQQRPLEAVNDTNSMIEITFWKINIIILFRGVKYVGKVFFSK